MGTELDTPILTKNSIDKEHPCCFYDDGNFKTCFGIGRITSDTYYTYTGDNPEGTYKVVTAYKNYSDIDSELAKVEANLTDKKDVMNTFISSYDALKNASLTKYNSSE